MGLLDQIIRSAVGSATSTATRGGSSPIVMALLALLASKAMAGRTSAGGSPAPNGGLGGLVESFQRGGLEDIIKSWIGTGPNKAISPDQLHQALGTNTVDDLAQETGLPKQDLLSQLSQLLPGVVDKLTPHGNVPTDGELLAGPRDDDEQK